MQAIFINGCNFLEKMFADRLHTSTSNTSSI